MPRVAGTAGAMVFGGVMIAVAAAQAGTAVSGPSWLHHLGIRYDDTSLGRGSGRYGASPDAQAVMRPRVAPSIAATVRLSGADLFRIDCQACHHAEGTGAPPEVRSVVPAVQGSSLAMMRAQLQRDGRLAVGTAQSRSTEAREALYRRIRQGGEKMPPRGYLRDAEID